jgi:hypothetical protein
MDFGSRFWNARRKVEEELSLEDEESCADYFRGMLSVSSVEQTDFVEYLKWCQAQSKVRVSEHTFERVRDRVLSELNAAARESAREYLRSFPTLSSLDSSYEHYLNWCGSRGRMGNRTEPFDQQLKERRAELEKQASELFGRFVAEACPQGTEPIPIATRFQGWCSQNGQTFDEGVDWGNVRAEAAKHSAFHALTALFSAARESDSYSYDKYEAECRKRTFYLLNKDDFVYCLQILRNPLVESSERCSYCHGKGRDTFSGVCTTCGGRGTIMVETAASTRTREYYNPWTGQHYYGQRHTPRSSHAQTCPSCGGGGKGGSSSVCTNCGGKGYTPALKRNEVDFSRVSPPIEWEALAEKG